MKLCAYLAALFIAASGMTFGAQSTGELEITYIANEGFLIAGGGKKVLIDALLREGIPESYLRPVPETLTKMESAQPPFDGVDVVLATHFHRDHFDAGSVAGHLKANPRAVFISVHEATSLVFKDVAVEARRVLTALPEYGRRISLTPSGISIQAIRLRHRRFENTGFLITLAGKKVLHLGDSEDTASNFDAFDLEKENIDIGLIPYWFFLSEEGKQVVRGHINARKLIAIHVGIDDGVRRDIEKIRREFPEVAIALKSGERWIF